MFGVEHVGAKLWRVRDILVQWSNRVGTGDAGHVDVLTGGHTSEAPL